MSPKIRIDGVYDYTTFNHLSNLGIEDFLFDCRPLSFQFIQQHCLNDILIEYQRPFQNYYLQFADEKDFVIQKLLRDLKETLKGPELEKKEVFLEFSGQEEVDFMESFQVPFYKQIEETTYLKPLLNSLYLKGMVFPFSYFAQLKEKGELDRFQDYFEQEMAQFQSLDIVLKLDWDDNVFGSLFDRFSFKQVSFPINANIESAYRQVNLKKAEEEIQFFIDNGLMGRVNKSI
jgi:hypothetical protein